MPLNPSTKAGITLDHRLQKTLLLDLEATRAGRLRHVGAVLDERVLEEKPRTAARTRDVLEKLDAMALEADFILGHNLLGHDLPVLSALNPRLELLKKPIIDTLYLSPLAFPQNPYHRLVKDYKLVRASINDPVADARLAGSLFGEQVQNLAAFGEKRPEDLNFFRSCFEGSLLGGIDGHGLSAVFEGLGARRFPSFKAMEAWFLETTRGIVCPAGIARIFAENIPHPATRPVLAYCLAWLRVAGSNSVPPPWVRHRFPGIPAILKALRDESCGDPGCEYCRENHNPNRQLGRYFGFTSFRETPRTEEGKSLQRAIVARGMKDRPLLAVLPTGAGKSLCYQLPALIRHRRRGLLTVVISPLQALMKDQVDNLVRATGTPFAEAVYGLLTPLERGAVLERVRLGDAAILYIAPEQLRSLSVRRVLKQREIGCWVFDEAHCLSKWGHDFRPDYLYAARFIREFSEEGGGKIPPVCGFTATAKPDVIQEVTGHFRDELEQDLVLFAGGVERDNLSFEVLPVSDAERFETTAGLVDEVLAGDETASVVIYAATRKRTEEIRDFLSQRGFVVEAFHGGMEPGEKREVMDSFMDGTVRVISATNAFGMGVDKDDIRLVLHVDMPGSLENYIQEAGRAGRDSRPARCVLLYDPEDADTQFGLGALTEIKQREIQRILRALRRAKHSPQGEIVITSDELLRDEDLGNLLDEPRDARDTKVKTAVSWLERSGYLSRNQNLTDVFQGRPLVTDMDQARERMAPLGLSPVTERLWLAILAALFNCPPDRGISADQIAEGLFPNAGSLGEVEAASGLTPAQVVIHALHDMAEGGLLDRGLTLSAVLRPKGKNNAWKVLREITDVENRLLALMRAEDPDAENGDRVVLSTPRLCRGLRDEGLETAPHVLQRLIKGLANDGKGLAASQGSLELHHVGRGRYEVRLQRSWDAVCRIASLRQRVSHAVLSELLRRAGGPPHSENPVGGDAHVSFTSSDLAGVLKNDLTLRGEVKKILPALDRALMFLHDNKVIHLQGGLAVLRQAMTIRLNPESRGRRYTLGDFRPLSVHYRERRFQVHVMVEYAALGLDRIAGALALVLDYFSLGRTRFVKKYFSDRKSLVEKAVTAESYRKIVEGLGNPLQIAAVGSPVERNLLILAGPGSGKTMVIVHRCAYLLQVERIPARQILVLCFNHNAAISVRKRLHRLVGRRSRGVTIATYHGVAMRLAGVSVRDLVESAGLGGGLPFDRLIKDALRLLRGEIGAAGDEPDEVRDRLLGGYSHILVDEYQDIDQDQYDLVSAIAGRSLAEGEGRLSIWAVGDDDQNIYGFRGANVEFIRRFQEDYPADVVHLVENYRSTRHIIDASNRLIRENRDRMKGDHPIRINREREAQAPGGPWDRLDPLARGRVQILHVRDAHHQAVSLAAELKRLESLSPGIPWDAFAVLSRTRHVLEQARSLLEQEGFPLKRTIEKTFPIHRVREVTGFLDSLKDPAQGACRASGLLGRRLEDPLVDPQNPWQRMIDGFLETCREMTGDALVPVDWIVEALYEQLAEQRRDKTLGDGLFLGTVHSAKGMEFSHVIVLDGDWSPPADPAAWEEERRLLYVAMTRARETLSLMRSRKTPNPLLGHLRGDSVLHREGPAPLPPMEETPFFSYSLLSLEEIFMDYAGGFAQDHPVHQRLQTLRPGDGLTLAAVRDRVEIRDTGGRPVGRLAEKSASYWRRELDKIYSVRVVAILSRTLEDTDPRYRDRIRTGAWEMPVLEVVLRQSPGTLLIF